jgi:hypothetical protein
MTQLSARYTSVVTVHRLTVQNAPGTLHDPDGQALHRLGVADRHTAQYLVRPDGHIGYRAGGTDVTGLARYLSRWLPGPATHPPAGVVRKKVNPSVAGPGWPPWIGCDQGKGRSGARRTVRAGWTTSQVPPRPSWSHGSMTSLPWPCWRAAPCITRRSVLA